MRTGAGQRPLSVFSMVMSWSRAIFIDFSFDQQMETFLRMHRRALEFFGGVPKRIVYDNLKSVVLHHIGSTVQWNPRFLAFAGHYLFEATAAPVRYPEFKGRVESSIKYIRHFLLWPVVRLAGRRTRRPPPGGWHANSAFTPPPASVLGRLLAERPRFRALPHFFDTDIVIPHRPRGLRPPRHRLTPSRLSTSARPSTCAPTTSVSHDLRRRRIARTRCWDCRRHIEDPAHLESSPAARPGTDQEPTGS
jgi:hypothetical protein